MHNLTECLPYQIEQFFDTIAPHKLRLKIR